MEALEVAILVCWLDIGRVSPNLHLASIYRQVPPLVCWLDYNEWVTPNLRLTFTYQ